MSNKVKFVILSVLLLLAILSALLCGAGNIIGELFVGKLSDEILLILRDIRLPRVLGAAAAGALLALAGCCVQLLFRNPLSSPHVLGSVNASALGAVLVLALGGHSLGWMLSGSCAGAAISMIFLLSLGRSRERIGTLLLAGIALNAFTSAIMSGLLFVAGERLEGLVFWLLGGFWRLDWLRSDVLLAASVLLLSLGWLMRREMNMLYLGENAAAHAGVDTRKVVAGAVLLCSLATALVVGNCGVIGFVGLLIPHVARRFFGGEFGIMILASALLGSLLTVLADLAARTLFAPLEIPVGILTSMLGAPFFLLIILQRIRRGSIDI